MLQDDENICTFHSIGGMNITYQYSFIDKQFIDITYQYSFFSEFCVSAVETDILDS